MRVDINLATHPYEDQRLFWMRWGTGVALLGILSAVLVFWTIMGLLGARKDRALLMERQQQIAAREQEKSAAQALLNLPENRSTRDRSQFLNDLFRRKSFSWTKVLENLETLMPPRLHVTSIHPDLNSDNQLVLKMVVAGESRDRALDLVRKMEGSQRFQETQIEQETFSSGNSANDAVQFDITALYIPEVDAVATAPAAAPAQKGGAKPASVKGSNVKGSGL
jgi:type IV pilus assembly protein PilN